MAVCFSELVDDLVARSGRPDRKADIASWLNLTIRECQGLGMFWKDRIELSVTQDADPYSWTPPSLLRQLEFVCYGDLNTSGLIPSNIDPSRQIVDKTTFYYAASTYYLFYGCGTDTTSPINLSYFTWQKRLRYYEAAVRPASYDEDTDTWTYVPPTTDPDEQLAAQALVTNWLIWGYADIVAEGTLAKVYQSVGDQTRNVTSYSLYKQNQQLILQGELKAGRIDHNPDTPA